MAKILVVTSGKGGVGKTTTSAAIGTGLALRGHKTVIVDFDVGLRNLDLIMGCERRVVYDFVNVVNGEANLQQALIKDKRLENLYVLAASQTRDKDALTVEGVEKVLMQLKEDFEFVVCDSPAGIEKGAHLAMYFADEAIVVTNPEVSSVRDSDRMLGLLASKSRRAENGEEPIKEHLLLTRYNPKRVSNGEMLGVEDVKDILAVTLLGVIPESQAVLKASNQGVPVILDDQSDAGQAYSDAVDRLLGKTVDHRFLDVEKKGFFERLWRSVMNLFDFFRANKKPNTASVAKERLQIIVAHERGQRSTPDYLPALQKELVEVIRKYVNIGSDDVHVALENQGSCSILELNITLPDR